MIFGKNYIINVSEFNFKYTSKGASHLAFTCVNTQVICFGITQL